MHPTRLAKKFFDRGAEGKARECDGGKESLLRSERAFEWQVSGTVSDPNLKLAVNRQDPILLND
jgi:hypothetical protein